MRGLDRPGAERGRRGHDPVDVEEHDRGRDPHAVDDGVEGAHFVQVDVARIDPVERTLDLGDTAHRVRRDLGDARGLRPPDDLEHVARRPVMGVVVDANVDAGRHETADVAALGRQLPPGQSGRGHRGPDRVERCAGVDERAEEHVARDAGDGIEEEDHAARPDARAMRYAAIAAP